MKLAGFLLLLAGWFIGIAALVMLPSQALRALFISCGLVVELLGLALVGRHQCAQAGEYE